MSDLQGRVVAITGAARGIGRACVRGFLSEGAKVVAMDRSWDPTGFSGDSDGSFLKDLERNPDNALVVSADISDDPQVREAYEAAMAKFGTIDALVNNASLRQRDLFPPTGRVTTLETKDSDWEKMFGVGVFGSLKVTRHFIQPMLEKKRGSVISVISSGAIHQSWGGAFTAHRPNSREMPYQSAKAALLTMMFYLADEVRESNVAVNTLIPALTRTTGYDEQNAARRAQGMVRDRTSPMTLRPEHIVPITLFLAQQDANSGITGKCFDTITWNMEHGYGDQATWVDVEAVPT